MCRSIARGCDARRCDREQGGGGEPGSRSLSGAPARGDRGGAGGARAARATVVDLRFGITKPRQYTLAEVGNQFGISRERVRQIERTALRNSAAAKAARNSSRTTTSRPLSVFDLTARPASCGAGFSSALSAVMLRLAPAGSPAFCRSIASVAAGLAPICFGSRWRAAVEHGRGGHAQGQPPSVAVPEPRPRPTSPISPGRAVVPRRDRPCGRRGVDRRKLNRIGRKPAASVGLPQLDVYSDLEMI